MKLPITYNLRNLWVRRTTSVMTALGIALTVAVLLAILALVNGLATAFEGTGHPENVLVLRSGADSELVSNLSREAFQTLKTLPGVKKDASGEPMASLELVSVIVLTSAETNSDVNITVRGLQPMGRTLRPGIKVAAGRWFNDGQREVVVGKSIAKRNPDAGLGKTIKFGKGDWKVVGIFDAGDSAANSEIWADLNQTCADYERCAVLSSALLRVDNPSGVKPMIEQIKGDQRLTLNAQAESTYYEAQTASAAPIQYLGIFVAMVMAVGSAFAAMNTMYAAVARRSREIGTLRVLGFSRFSVLTSFFLESLLLALLGGILGCLLVLPLNGLTTGIGSFTTFSEVAFNFRITPQIMGNGVVFALVMGALGGLLPAFSAARKEILTALREV